MEPETPASAAEMPPAIPQAPAPRRRMHWLFVGDQGLRAGWSVAIFIAVFALIFALASFLFAPFAQQGQTPGFSPLRAAMNEFVALLALLGAAAVVSLVERHGILAYNLHGPRRPLHFASGVVWGFAALSALVGLLAAGGWMHFGPVALSGAAVARFASFWAGVFLLVGCFEEGLFRCYLLSTLARGLNFWWALGLVAAMCLFLAATVRNSGTWGVYGFALLGLIPCAWLHRTRAEGNGFWQAAWVTSTGFGFIHTGNNGENWIGIFAAAAIGFVFCASVRLTGSAWWAIGCHAAWDWAETFFYGTADSGLVARGHLLTSAPAGSPLWSGGADGPEGSLLVLVIIALLLVGLLLQYGRKRVVSLVPEASLPLPG